MDQKIQGASASPAGEREKEGGGGKKEEDGEKNNDGGTGSTGAGGTADDPSFSVKESSMADGNLKLKIGLQAKRMKKPPKSLENFVCRPAFRATVRHTPRSGSNTKTKSATSATGDGAGSQNKTPATQPKDKEKREKSPSVNNNSKASSANKTASSANTAAAKAPTPPLLHLHLAPPTLLHLLKSTGMLQLKRGHQRRMASPTQSRTQSQPTPHQSDP
ncbi:hypothetical protein WMY93_019716 [Mugilogobius chulae]|uniref:Uncharacterized protein n=1 Tax=Mugilogobius chulae TaxID=88201 RepID=A0AAW0NHZ8_9GOBI